MKLGIMTLSGMALLLSAQESRADGPLALSAERGSVAGRFLASDGVMLEFDARVGADGSVDVVVTHEFAEIVGAIADGTSKLTTLAGVSLDEAADNPELGRRVRAVIDSPLWAAYRELVLALRERIDRRETSHAKMVVIL